MYIIIDNISVEQHNEIVRWCIENCKFNWWYGNAGCFNLSHKNDQLLFRMRWGGEIINE